MVYFFFRWLGSRALNCYFYTTNCSTAIFYHHYNALHTTAAALLLLRPKIRCCFFLFSRGKRSESDRIHGGVLAAAVAEPNLSSAAVVVDFFLVTFRGWFRVLCVCVCAFFFVARSCTGWGARGTILGVHIYTQRVPCTFVCGTELPVGWKTWCSSQQLDWRQG